MRRVLGLMLFCFGIGMTLLLFIPETLSTLIFIIGCLTLGYYLFCCSTANENCKKSSFLLNACVEDDEKMKRKQADKNG